MKFTCDWFSNNVGYWSQWLGPMRGKPVKALEIGCYEGRATTWLLENVLTHPDAKITCIDTFGGSVEHTELGVPFDSVEATFRENVRLWGDKVTILKGPSSEWLRKVDGRFDFVYVDGSHIAADVLTDSAMAWPLVKSGGFVIFDDYMWDHYSDPVKNPRIAVDAFLAVFKGQYKLVSKEYQVCVQKL